MLDEDKLLSEGSKIQTRLVEQIVKELKEVDAKFIDLNSVYEELCVQEQDEQMFEYEAYLDFVMGYANSALDALSVDEQKAISYNSYIDNYTGYDEDEFEAGDIDLDTCATDIVNAIRSIAADDDSDAVYCYINGIDEDELEEDEDEYDEEEENVLDEEIDKK